MPWFVTIGYGDEAGYAQTDRAVLERAHAVDERLGAEGVIGGIAGTPVQVRNRDGARVEVTEGAYMRSELSIAGISVIEARDLDDAVRRISGTPCAVAQGVVEVWPLVH